MKQITQGLKALGTQIDLILSSPYVRAADTAHILAEELGLNEDKLVMTENLSPVGQPDGLMTEIRKNHADVENLALVGHEPSLSRLISVLLSGDPTLPIILKKGGVCRLSADKIQYGRCATLEWLLAPAQLAEIRG